MGIKLKAGQFYGSKSEVFPANGYCFSESTYAPSSQLPTHAHELAHFCLVIEGSYAETIGSRTYDRVPATLVYYPTDVSHSEKHLTNGRHFLIEIQPSALKLITDYGANLNEPVSFDRLSVNGMATRLYNEYREPDEFSALSLESISTELLIAASRMNRVIKEGRPPKWLNIVKDLLRDSDNAPASLNDVAAVAGVHPTHLARVFRRFEQCTIGHYVRRSRIECVKTKMLTTDDSLAQIAVEAGFSDQSHFTRSFKSVTGMTPSQFRNIFRSPANCVQVCSFDSIHVTIVLIRCYEHFDSEVFMKRSVSVLTVLLLIALISTPQRVFAEADSPEARVDAFLKPYIDGGFFFGVIVLTRDGKVTYEKAFGPANAEFHIPNQANTRIGIASITKPMTSVILIRLLEAKKLTLDDKLSKFIPDFPNGDKITVDMLSKHRSGIPHRVMKPEMESLPYTTTEMVENIKKAALAFDPGTQRLYSSAGYTVLARVLEIASGKSYPELLQEYVLTPADMTDTLNFESEAVMERRAEDYMYSNNGFINAELKNYSFLVGAGSVFSTARDLSKFSHAIIDGKFGSNVRSFFVTGPTVTADGSTNGHRSYLEVERDKKYGFVVLSNIGSGSFQAITKGIGEIMQGKELSVKPPSIPKIIPDPNKDPGEFLGVYKRTDDGSETTLLRKKGELYAENIKLFPIRPDCFFEYKFFGEVCFQRDNSAKITGIKWKGTGFELAWVKK